MQLPRFFIGCVLLSVVSVLSNSEAKAAAPAPVLSSDLGQEYTHSHDLVDVGNGHKMNLFCMGKGKPTIVFDSGLSDWSSIWALVQPDIAKITRACSYDRAGMGYSDASNTPARSPIAIDEDLHTLLRAAKIATPVVLVGHSLGGFNMKLYTALYPKDVAGLVLVDPAEDRIIERTNPILSAKYGEAFTARLTLDDLSGTQTAIAQYNSCAAATTAKDLDPTSDEYKKCTDPVRSPLGPDIAAARLKIQVKHLYQVTQASELASSAYGDSQPDPIYARLFSGQPFGYRPLIVLTHSIYDNEDPEHAADYLAWDTTHDQTAHLSRRGINRIVPGTHHNIEVDQPQAIVEAVEEVLKAVADPQLQVRQ